MIIYVIFSQILNPFLSANILAPDDYTDDYFVTIYQFGIENDFYRREFGWGGYVEYFYKKDYLFSDPYYITSGLPIAINAFGWGLQAKYLGMDAVEFGIKLGYYNGSLSYPILGDSGIVIKIFEKRNSLGLSMGTNIMHNLGRIRAGIKFWFNLIKFDAEGPRTYGYYAPSPDYISLSSVGLGITLGINNKK